jgi:hypothetical protein
MKEIYFFKREVSLPPYVLNEKGNRSIEGAVLFEDKDKAIDYLAGHYSSKPVKVVVELPDEEYAVLKSGLEKRLKKAEVEKIVLNPHKKR